MATLPVAQVVHAAPGRLRLRVPAMRRNAAFFARLAESMELAAIGNVYASSVTGSILIEGSSLSVTQFRELASARSWLDITPLSPQIESNSRAPTRWQVPSPEELMRTAPLALLALAAIQAARGQLLPSALSLLSSAIDIGRAQAERH